MAYQLTHNKYLLPPELLALQTTLAKSGARDSILLQTILCSGGRAQEVLNLRGCDLNPAAHSVFIRGLKGSNDREIPLPRALFEQLLQLSAAGGEPSSLVFGISYARLYQIWDHWRPATAKSKGIHSLRHTFAIELYKKCRDLRLVQVALGHKSITNTMVYSAYVYSQEELRKQLVG
jgi:integrase